LYRGSDVETFLAAGSFVFYGLTGDRRRRRSGRLIASRSSPTNRTTTIDQIGTLTITATVGSTVITRYWFADW
jgi:hypothetical protein